MIYFIYLVLIKPFLPESIIKKLPPSYKLLPATLLGSLAVDINYKGQGVGTNLLMDALKRSYINSLQIASMAVIVDPLDNEAIAFYNHFGFIELPNSGKMFLPMSQLEQIFNDNFQVKFNFTKYSQLKRPR